MHSTCILINICEPVVLHERKKENKIYLSEFMLFKLFKSKLKNTQIIHENQCEFKHMKLFKIKVYAAHNVNISY